VWLRIHFFHFYINNNYAEYFFLHLILVPKILQNYALQLFSYIHCVKKMLHEDSQKCYFSNARFSRVECRRKVVVFIKKKLGSKKKIEKNLQMSYFPYKTKKMYGLSLLRVLVLVRVLRCGSICEDPAENAVKGLHPISTQLTRWCSTHVCFGDVITVLIHFIVSHPCSFLAWGKTFLLLLNESTSTT
jgi:hypothetical protein